MICCICDQPIKRDPVREVRPSGAWGRPETFEYHSDCYRWAQSARPKLEAQITRVLPFIESATCHGRLKLNQPIPILGVRP